MNRKQSFKLALLGLLFVTTIVMAQTKPKDASPPLTQPAKEKQTFAIVYEPGPKWAKGVEIFEQDLQEHGEYMQKLLDAGKLELGGPFSDSSGGMAIILVDGEDEASGILEADPAIKKGIFTAKLRPWYIVFRAHPRH
jgi:uncharacterized protein YciI